MRTRFVSHARTIGATLLAGLTCAVPDSAAAEPRSRSETAGLGAGLGVGASAAGYGAGLIYYQPLGSSALPRWTLFASVAMGVSPTPDSPLYLDADPAAVPGGAAAAGLCRGRRHRICAEVGYGAFGTQTIEIEGIIIDAVASNALFLDAGYEFAADNGFLVRLLPLGFGYFTSPLLPSKDRSHWSVSSFVGWKLW